MKTGVKTFVRAWKHGAKRSEIILEDSPVETVVKAREMMNSLTNAAYERAQLYVNGCCTKERVFVKPPPSTKTKN